MVKLLRDNDRRVTDRDAILEDIVRRLDVERFLYFRVWRGEEVEQYDSWQQQVYCICYIFGQYLYLLSEEC